MKLRKNYAIVLLIALSFMLISNGQTWADENTQTYDLDSHRLSHRLPISLGNGRDAPSGAMRFSTNDVKIIIS